MGVRGTTYRDVVVLALMSGPASIADVLERIDVAHWQKARHESWSRNSGSNTIVLGYQNIRTRLLRLERDGWVREDDGAWQLRTPAEREQAREQARRAAEPDAKVLGLVDQIERESGLKLRLEVREGHEQGFATEFGRIAVLVTERGEIEYSAPQNMAWVEFVRAVVPE